MKRRRCGVLLVLVLAACGGSEPKGSSYSADVVLRKDSVAQAGVTIVQAVLCEAVDSAGAPQRPQSLFAAGAEPHLVVELAGAPAGTLVEANWYFGKALVTGQNTNTDEINGGRVSFHLIPDAPLVPGDYRVVVLAAGAKREVPFTVASAASAR